MNIFYAEFVAVIKVIERVTVMCLLLHQRYRASNCYICVCYYYSVYTFVCWSVILFSLSDTTLPEAFEDLQVP